MGTKLHRENIIEVISSEVEIKRQSVDKNWKISQKLKPEEFES